MRLIVLMFASVVSACGPFMSMERVPTEADVRAWRALEPFVENCGAISGIYQNLDIDSVVLRCRPLDRITEAEFWRAIATASSAAGWVEERAATEPVETKVFERLATRQGREQFSGSEEIRIAWTPEHIAVGYVQADHAGDPKPVRDSSEGKFAEQTIWPRFNKLLPQ